MATQQGSGLFGMPTPQEARQQYEQGLFLSPAQIGSQGLLQQVVSTIGEAGAGVGYGLGRMLGGMPAQEAEAIGMQEAAAEVAGMGIIDPAKRMTALADALQRRGLSRAAMQALDRGRKMQLEDVQRRAAEGRMKQLTPIYGPTQTQTDPLGKTTSIKPIIGYMDGEGTRYTVAQVRSMFPDKVAADEAAGAGDQPSPKTPAQLAAAERERRAAAAKKEGKEPPKTPITTEADFEQRYTEALDTSQQLAIINEAIKNGVVTGARASQIIKRIEAKRPKVNRVRKQTPAAPVGLPPVMEQPIGGA